MIGNILTELITDTIAKSILNEAESSDARQAAKQLGLIYKGFGRYVHPNNPQKVVAKTINGKLVRTHPRPEEPAAEPSKQPPSEPTKTAPTTVINKGGKPEEIPNPYDSEKPTRLAKQSTTKWKFSDFEKKAVQKDRDLSAELLKAKGPMVLTHIQNLIDNYKKHGVHRGSPNQMQSPDEQLALQAKYYTLRDNIMDMIPISDTHKIPTNMKDIYARHKLKQIAYKTVDKYGSLDGAIEAADKAFNNPNSSANKPLIKKIHSILTSEKNILQGDNAHRHYNDEPIDNTTAKRNFGI